MAFLPAAVSLLASDPTFFHPSHSFAVLIFLKAGAPTWVLYGEAVLKILLSYKSPKYLYNLLERANMDSKAGNYIAGAYRESGDGSIDVINRE